METVQFTVSQSDNNPASQVYLVWRDVVDAEGYTLEHLSEVVGRFNTQAEAVAFAQRQH